MSDNHIHVEEELHDATVAAKDAGRRMQAEFQVRGAELKEVLARLVKEATVRKITIKNQSGKTLFEVPLALGTLGMLFIGPWSAALLAAAWLARVSILIEYVEAPSKVEEAMKETADKAKAAVA